MSLPDDTHKTAYLGGGCFWGMEELFRQRPGVVDTQVGYAGGTNENPTYEHHPGHAETLAITFNPRETSYEAILDYFFRIHDLTTKNRQGNDIGTSYRSVIFYQDEKELQTAQNMIERVNTSDRWENPVATTPEPFTAFYDAEEYHQDYLQKNPGGYTCHLERFGSYIN